MSYQHKTANVSDLKRMLNGAIQREQTLDGRRALCSTLESILHAANAYHGFSYTDGWHGTETYLHEYY